MIEKIFSSKHIVPAAYKLILDENLEAGWVHWEPEAVWAEIYRIFHVNPTYEVKAKINAIKLLISTELFYHDAPVFENVVLAVNDLFVDPTTLQVATPEEIVYALRVIKPIENRPQDFGREIIAYIQVSCEQVGLLKYPNELKFAQPKYNTELATIVDKIKAEYTDPDKLDLADVVKVQGLKLYQVNTYVIDKLAKMDVKAFEPSVA